MQANCTPQREWTTEEWTQATLAKMKENFAKRRRAEMSAETSQIETLDKDDRETAADEGPGKAVGVAFFAPLSCLPCCCFRQVAHGAEQTALPRLLKR
jgi:hypothetical protein